MRYQLWLAGGWTFTARLTRDEITEYAQGEKKLVPTEQGALVNWDNVSALEPING